MLAGEDVLDGLVLEQAAPGLGHGGLGELAVLSVQPHSALARIIESRYPIYTGDRLERK